MKKVAVIGGTGMVASRFIELSGKNFDITSIDEKTLDITDREAVELYFNSNKFDSIINFAAYTDVDGAETQNGDEKGLVWKLNVGGSQNLAEVSSKNGICLIHISTDFVFPGNMSYPCPYFEDSKLPENPDGIGWYGLTKNRAENAVSNINPQASIVRYGYPFRASPFELKLDWARNLIRLYDEQKLYPLFDDQIYSILFIDDLVKPLSKIIEERVFGIFHIASSNTTNPYETGKCLLEKYKGKEVNLQKGSMEEFLKIPKTTPRPQFGGINNVKTQKTLNIKFRTWTEMIDEFIDQLDI